MLLWSLLNVLLLRFTLLLRHLLGVLLLRWGLLSPSLLLRLRLLGALLLLWWLGTLLRNLLCALLLRLRLRCTLLLGRLLSVLLLRWGASLLFRLILLLSIVAGLSGGGSNCSEKQKHRQSADKNEFHKDYLRIDCALRPPSITAGVDRRVEEGFARLAELPHVPTRNDIRSHDRLSSKSRLKTVGGPL